MPATSANLGPGFDALGLALGLRDRVTAEVIASGLEITVSGAGAEEVPLDERHLVVRAVRECLAELGESAPGLRLRCDNAIPHSRGLGSSAAAIVSGIFAARALVADGVERLDDEAAFRLAARIEGHPDNVAPAIFGGLTISGLLDDFWTIRLDVHPDITAVVFVPPTGLSTHAARGLLPDRVPHGDAAANAGFAALLVAALTTRPDRLHLGTYDRLHQTYRAQAMPESLALIGELRDDGVAAVVSGAGPSVLAFGGAQTGGDPERLLVRCPPGWTAHHLVVDTDGVMAG